MGVNRRQALLLTAGYAALPLCVRAEAPAPAIFADFGAAAGDRAAFDQAIARGADFLTTPVAPSKDGGLVSAPDAELSAFTDVARRPEFVGRRREAEVDGARVAGWFVHDFTIAELRTLAVGPAARGGREPPPALLAFGEVVDIARAGCVREARVIGVSPRLVRPAFFAAQETPAEPLVAQAIRRAGYDGPAAAMIVQAAEPASLRALAALTPVRRVQIADAQGGPVDPAAPRYAAMLSPDGLALVKGWAGAIAPTGDQVIEAGPRGALVATGLVATAKSAGLRVFARVPVETPRLRLRALFQAGVDGVMCADVGGAARARREAFPTPGDDS